MSAQTEERWVHGNSIDINRPEFLWYFRTFQYFYFELFLGQIYTRLFASIPAPDPTKGWKVKSLMLRYSISAPFSEFGISGTISAIGVFDGERHLWSTTLNRGLTNGFQILKVDLPEPTNYNYGLAVSINPKYEYIYGAPWYTEFYISSVGIEFLRAN